MTTQTVTTKLNGIQVDALMDFIGAIQENPELAKSQFRSKNHWVLGGHNRSEVNGFRIGPDEHERVHGDFVHDLDEPPALLGRDIGANPVEYLLTALSGCITTSFVMHASAKGIKLNSVESTYEGELDLQGLLNLDDSVRSGYQNIRVTFKVDADAPREEIEELLHFAKFRSPVFDSISNPVSIDVRLAD